MMAAAFPSKHEEYDGLLMAEIVVIYPKSTFSNKPLTFLICSLLGVAIRDDFVGTTCSIMGRLE